MSDPNSFKMAKSDAEIRLDRIEILAEKIFISMCCNPSNTNENIAVISLAAATRFVHEQAIWRKRQNETQTLSN